MKITFDSATYSLEKTLLSGQTFRWNRVGHNYFGVIGSSVLKASQKGAQNVIEVVYGDISENEIINYFSINERYDDIINSIVDDPFIRKSLATESGYRILRQDPYETIISFIDSANNSIANIRRQLALMSQLFGTKLWKNFYAFPSLDKLATISEDEIRKAKVGFRGKYMLSAAQKINSYSNITNLKEYEPLLLRNQLKTFHGVGDKIADCVMLFSFNHLDRMPIDVWTRKVFNKLYNLNEKAKYDEVHDFAISKFGKYAGYAGSFLFEAARKGNLF
ncbi:hypothetical protein JW887_05305 [Candidatus Dojkabacteria bacterium]|nr:hypothetical protein [Candidatus Dojkabacteria bacterium]